MRKALTLVELIFTIVIIALVFTVIPKVMYSLTKSDNFSIRQDALFAGVSLTNTISRLPWDEQNNLYPDILHTESTFAPFDCNSITKRRIGGFVGSRDCDNNLTAFSLGTEGEAQYSNYDDIDDFVDTNVTAKLPSGDILYELNTTVVFLDDTFNYNYGNKSVNVNLKNAIDVNDTSNLKKTQVIIYYAGKRGVKRQLSQFEYTSSNIGQIILNKRTW